jgi:hypothetical protein
MNLFGLAVAIVVLAAATLFFAVKSREFCKFLSGAFFVSAGTQLYLYLAKVSVPLLGTSFVVTPGISRVRWIPHFALFLITLYFGFLRKPARA